MLSICNFDPSSTPIAFDSHKIFIRYSKASSGMNGHLLRSHGCRREDGNQDCCAVLHAGGQPASHPLGLHYFGCTPESSC